MTLEEDTNKILLYLSVHGKACSKTIKSATGIKARRLRKIREYMENKFIDGFSDVLIGGDNEGYFIVDIDDDVCISSYIRRRKSMIFAALKLVYKLEKALMLKRQKHCQYTFDDFLDNLRVHNERSEETFEN